MQRQSGRFNALLLSPIGILGVYVLLSPLLSLLDQALFAAIALLLRAASAPQFLTELLTRTGFDPVYASVIDQTMGAIDVKGVALAGLLGGVLHNLAPGLFVPSDQVVSGAWASAVVGDGVSILAASIAGVGTEVIFIAIGVAFVWLGLRGYRAENNARLRTLAILGALLQVKGILGLVAVQFTFDDLEAIGVSQVFTKLVPLDAETYHRMVVGPLQTIGPFLVPACAIPAIYIPLGGLGALAVRRARRAAVPARGWAAMDFGLSSWVRGNVREAARTGCVLAGIVLTVVLSEGVFPAEAHYARPLHDQSHLAVGQRGGTTSTDRAFARSVQAGPSEVTVSGSNYVYTYTVNDRRERIHGVGYNSLYTSLSPEERAVRYDRDFAQMRAAGVNTILGWSAQQFDELTLTKAQEYGLGVVMPFRLPSDGSYADPQYADKVEGDVLRWVERFRTFPALRMWGIGNEVIHGMKNANTPQAQAFADFYVKLVDKVHALDPSHPVTYRAAEDVYLLPLKRALQSDKRARPWFVYGVNFFTQRICEALQNWSQKGVDIPLMVSEFGPAGLSRDDRPSGYRRMWGCIADRPNTVLGGFAYVWSIEGPEALDRSFGLVNPDNVAMDGSLATLAEAFRLD